jgi:hypothetical protein
MGDQMQDGTRTNGRNGLTLVGRDRWFGYRDLYLGKKRSL